MKFSRIAGLVTAAIALMGCQSNQGSQTYSVESNAGNSSLIIGKSAHEFSSEDIEVPAYFNTQGLQFCTYEAEEKDTRCPLAKKTIRLYFGDVKTDVNENLQGKSADVFNSMHSSISKFQTKALENTLENQFAGVNRFRILTRDTDAVNTAMEEILVDEGAVNVAKKAGSRGKLSTDYIMKVDVLKTADMLFGSTQSLFQTSMEMTTGVIDPYTREKVSYPNIGKIRVSNFDVRDKDSYTTVIANGDYYRGFNYTSGKDVDAVLNEMSSRGFDIMLTRLLKEMPATAQVNGIKGDRISLDRGQNAGVLPNETMVIFEYSAGFVEPIGVATVNPSQQSAQGKIVRWKDSSIADEVKDIAEDGIYRPDRQRRIFAVSVGVPMEFMKERSTWAAKG
ncbi:hypothetical protein AB4559_17625 [Vibrio sp. 10N.222.51.C8]|uniref:hypothetical protein n=1 Tax=unclassified Vibrio TaxID=2614977 RepID=UPI0009C06DEA|nr:MULTISPECIES: hypothetical protein [unclassified Vibrio]OQQ08040.1 hypothetical protein BK411_10420 [Vibrio splendidus]PMK23377.1 hypothetical protein BCU05_10060 [Vibrio sp. 10N.261.54.C3]PMN93254.1 hypothetical protein BCT21_20335 [Vibrio sp. 10N.222.55.F9]PMO08797.1 hypothetical protein BCT17_20140 [Vibrio sp. 10N.222.54.F10]PMO11240.1 hypothetical protein BCT20_21450 [Vibrio sp. 10N.222.55.C12]